MDYKGYGEKLESMRQVTNDLQRTVNDYAERLERWAEDYYADREKERTNESISTIAGIHSRHNDDKIKWADVDKLKYNLIKGTPMGKSSFANKTFISCPQCPNPDVCENNGFCLADPEYPDNACEDCSGFTPSEPCCLEQVSVDKCCDNCTCEDTDLSEQEMAHFKELTKEQRNKEVNSHISSNIREARIQSHIHEVAEGIHGKLLATTKDELDVSRLRLFVNNCIHNLTQGDTVHFPTTSSQLQLMLSGIKEGQYDTTYVVQIREQVNMDTQSKLFSFVIPNEEPSTVSEEVDYNGILDAISEFEQATIQEDIVLYEKDDESDEKFRKEIIERIELAYQDANVDEFEDDDFANIMFYLHEEVGISYDMQMSIESDKKLFNFFKHAVTMKKELQDTPMATEEDWSSMFKK